MSSTTLRQLNQFDPEPGTLANSTLVFVDFQNTYTTGVMELVGWREAIASARTLLERARAAGAPVIHVVNDGGEGTPYDIGAEIGRIHPDVAPADGEPTVIKMTPNAFHDTDLGQRVQTAGRDHLIVVGFMTHMCVEFTSQGGFLAGQHVTVVADACATRDLEVCGRTVPAQQLHDSALAAINDLFGVVVATQAAIA